MSDAKAKSNSPAGAPVSSDLYDIEAHVSDRRDENWEGNPIGVAVILLSVVIASIAFFVSWCFLGWSLVVSLEIYVLVGWLTLIFTCSALYFRKRLF